MAYTDRKRKRPDKDTRVIAVINQKGGVGKSTTVVNLSAALGDNGYKILVIDFDPQGNTTSGFGIEKDDLEISVYDVITGEADIEESIKSTAQMGVYVVPSTVQLSGAEIELVNEGEREFTLYRAIRGIVDEFDYVFIDCPPSLGLLSVNALVAAESVLIPIQCEYYALEGVSKLLESMKMVQGNLNPELKVFGVLMTMYDGRTTLAKQVVQEVRGHFGKDVFKTMIPRSVKVSEAPSYGQPVTMYARFNKGAAAYRNLAKEVVRRG